MAIRSRLATVLALGCVTVFSPAFAATFSEDVLPILQENCQVCHRPGGANLGGMVAPMSFDTYEKTRPWAKAMAKAVETGAMPPWHAAPEQDGHFENERRLTEDEIATIVAWANTGAKRGNPNEAPDPIAWPDHDGWMIGEPDLVVQPDKPFFVEDDVEDLYVNLETKMTKKMLPEDKFIKAVEFRPGSPVVHHIITYPLGGIAPGNEATVYPEGIASELEKGTDLSWEMHYHKEPGEGTGVWDHSSAAIKFYDDPDDVKYWMQGNDLGTYDFKIPAGSSDYTITEEYVFKHDSRVTSLMPHFHLRGKSAKYEAFYPDGSSEILLEVPRYDFNWQTEYKYGKFKKIPKGTKVVFTSVFDNSPANPFNPDPSVSVRYGEPTTDEMSYGYINFINDSDDYEYFFEEFDSETPDMVTMLWALDANHDEKLQKDEAFEDFLPYWGMIDKNRDGAMDLDEAKAANELMKQMAGGAE